MARESLSAVNVLRELTEAASRFVDRAPRQQRLEADRQALLDAITRAQLVLSVGSRKTDEPTHPDISEAQSLLKSVPAKDYPASKSITVKPPARRKAKTRKA